MGDAARAVFDAAAEFLAAYGLWVAAGSVLMLVASLVVIRVLVVRIPEDYFIRESPLLAGVQHPAWEIALLLLKNAVGAVLVLFGLLMSLPGVAGPGVLTILAGLSLMNFPGKRRLQRMIVGQPIIQRSINGIRAKAGRPPLLLDEPVGGAGEGGAAK